MAPSAIKCIQCKTLGCGWDVCRFSGLSHEHYRAALDAINAYANAGVKRDQADRYSGRPDHDMRCDGMPLKPGT